MTKPAEKSPARLDDAAEISFALDVVEIFEEKASAQALADLAAVYHGF
jgi:hypothetical protein